MSDNLPKAIDQSVYVATSFGESTDIQNSVTAAIGSDLLKIDPNDDTSTIRRKILVACKSYPGHLTEIMLAGMAALLCVSDSRDEMLENCMFAFRAVDTTNSN